ncbi:MAG TPA: sigma-54-dependent Fis family transcriptional regulator [Candidatus Cryptobacteroides intestinipullorum]|nr:sigma-54-dependent Fis family transcriptional regulator [Candidatus Cryptobacteroides intestinipullorum]
MTAQELQNLKNKFDIIGNDPALNRALEIAVAVAPTDLTVLISGESGVGKENIPKIIHQNSLRRTGKYFAINCGAIPEGTIDSELFGHEKGSFTGANEMRRGYFEEADGGTLFLDEVGELPLPSQAKLLRVLQSGEFIRVGSSKVLKTDVRVVAATNVNLRYAVSRGKFREDLYYRLNAVSILMPALRERKDDIHLLFRKFASDFAARYNIAKISLTEDAVTLLKTYRWPGNIRQLKNVAETVSAIESVKSAPGSERREINAATLGKYLPKDDPNLLPAKADAADSAFSSSEREMIVRTIYQLRQDVDYLKSIISGGGQTMPAGAAIPETCIRREAPDDQHAGEVFKENPEPEEQTAVNVTRESPDNLSIEKTELELIKRALDKYKGNRKLAAEELGISERTLYRKLKSLE